MRRVIWILVGIAVLPALVSMGTDLALYNGVVRSPLTTYVSRDEYSMLEWIRTNTPRDQVLQLGYPGRIFGKQTPLLLEALAERRTFYGNDEMPRMFRVPPELLAERLGTVTTLLTETKTEVLSGSLQHLPPLYLFLDKTDTVRMRAIRELELQGRLRRVHENNSFALDKTPGFE